VYLGSGSIQEDKDAGESQDISPEEFPAGAQGSRTLSLSGTERIRFTFDTVNTTSCF
jgi:hypothetical protein